MIQILDRSNKIGFGMWQIMIQPNPLAALHGNAGKKMQTVVTYSDGWWQHWWGFNDDNHNARRSHG